MKRREFIKSAFALSAFGTQIPIMALGRKNKLGRSVEWESDRIVVLIKLNGGNDGLNTIIPVQNDIYYNARPTLAISQNQALGIDDYNGFHPSLSAFHSLFQNEQMSLIHGVGYHQPNLSHFRSSDIWVTGSDANEYLQTGWIGRLLEQEYPDFPSNAPDHPLAIQFNSANLLEFKTSMMGEIHRRRLTNTTANIQRTAWMTAGAASHLSLARLQRISFFKVPRISMSGMNNILDHCHSLVSLSLAGTRLSHSCLLTA